MTLTLTHCEQSVNPSTGLPENCCGFTRGPDFCPSSIHKFSSIEIEGEPLNLTYNCYFLTKMKIHDKCLLLLKSPPEPPMHPNATPTTMCTCLIQKAALTAAEKAFKKDSHGDRGRKRAAAQLQTTFFD